MSAYAAARGVIAGELVVGWGGTFRVVGLGLLLVMGFMVALNWRHTLPRRCHGDTKDLMISAFVFGCVCDNSR